MLIALPPEAAGFLALAALALLPGLLLVRAPWTAVPALSVAFWMLGWWWLPLGGRSRLLAGALVLFSMLAVLRFLPKHSVPPPPGHAGPEPSPPVTGPTTGDVPRFRTVPSLVVTGVALALLVPLPLWHHVPGREMAFHTTSVRLAVWRDALPPTHEPLLPLPHFGSHAPGFPTLAADVSLLSGLDPGRSAVVAALLLASLLLMGLYGLLGTRMRPSAAALGALLGLATAPWPGFLAMWGEGGPLLALGLGLSAAALILGHSSRPSAAAAGMLLGAGLLAQPVLTLGMGGVIAAWMAWVGEGRAAANAVIPSPPAGTAGEESDARARGIRSLARRPHDGALRDDMSSARARGSRSLVARSNDGAPRDDRAGRLGVAFGMAVVLAGPALVRLAEALSAKEAAGVLTAIEGREVMSFVTGLALLGLAAFLARLLVEARPRTGVLTGALVVVSAVILLVGAHAGPAGGQLEPESLHALADLEAEHEPLEAVCAPEGVLDWVPALAGRVAGGMGKEGPEPWVPHALREEWARAPRPGCSKKLDASPWRR